MDITEGIVSDIFNMSTLMKKLSRKVHQKSYLEELEENDRLREMRNLLMNSIHSVISQVQSRLLFSFVRFFFFVNRASVEWLRLIKRNNEQPFMEVCSVKQISQQ